MSYESFAYFYDQLMDEAPYDEWLAFFERAIEQYNISKQKPMLEVGTGTGELLSRLCNKGYNVSGVDLSADMLTVARSKLNATQDGPLLIEQDMRFLDLGTTFSTVFVFCDTLNYLLTVEDVLQAFERFNVHLEMDGLLLFDVHSLYKVAHGFINQTFADANEEISYIWHSFSGELENSVEHELTFFVRNDDNSYKRFDELHYQRTFSIETYQALLEQAGFVVHEVIADFKHPLKEDGERIFFIAQKKESIKK